MVFELLSKEFHANWQKGPKFCFFGAMGGSDPLTENFQNCATKQTAGVYVFERAVKILSSFPLPIRLQSGVLPKKVSVGTRHKLSGQSGGVLQVD